MIFLLLFLFQNGYAYQFPTASQQLYCNRIIGDRNHQTVLFTRPLQNGDMITWNGTVVSAASIRYSLYNGDQIPFHWRQDLPAQHTIFNNFVGRWGTEAYGPSFYQIGQPYQVSVKLVGNQFQAFSNGVLLYTFPVRSAVDNIVALDSVGSVVINWIEMECANPPFTTRAPRPSRRPRRDHGGHGHGGRGGHGRFSSSGSSSDESC
uniref:Galectin n=1 Tax=Caenorhabditis tropicalis TaxID=1561998 RepID=A0A1I7UGA9_9PELO